LRGRNHRIRRSEPAQRAIVPARAVEIQSEAGFLSLTGELVVRTERAGRVARLTEGFVLTGCFAIQRGGGLDSARVGRDRRTAEVVTEQVGQRPIRADGESGRTREIIFRDRRPLFLVILTPPT
jgi:hypothetical protein